MSIYKQIVQKRKELKEKLLNSNSPNSEQYEIFNVWRDLRKVNSLIEFPLYVQAKLRLIIAYIELRFPNTEYIKLVGSYANGEYIDEVSTDLEKEIKLAIRHKNKISDFDIEIDENVYEIVEIDGIKIHILKPGMSQGFYIKNKQDV
jgi:hypothetical protein